MIAERFEQDELRGMFAYLDALRESGVTNMFGASPYLVEEYDLSQREAKVILVCWMQSFDRNASADVRAEKVWRTSYEARAERGAQ